SPGVSPSARYSHAMAYDSARGVTVLFGGYAGGPIFGDTWEWNGMTWTQISSAVSPAARLYHAMAYDSARRVTVLFGGSNGSYFGDTWKYGVFPSPHPIIGPSEPAPN